MILKRIIHKEKLEPIKMESDYNFDFSMYEREEKEETTTKSILKDTKPRITNLRSKYGAAIQTVDLLQNVRTNLTEKAIDVASRTDDIKDIWDLYGCINEAWSIFKDVYGTGIINEVKEIDEEVLKLLLDAQKKDEIPEEVYLKMLNYKDKLYLLMQRANLGLEVEKNRGTHFKKAKSGMVE